MGKKKKKTKLSTYKSSIKTDDFTYLHIDNLTHQAKNLFNSYLFYANHYYKFKYFLITNYKNGNLTFPAFCNNLIVHFKSNFNKVKDLENLIFPYIKNKYNYFIPTYFYNYFLDEKVNVRKQFNITEENIYDTILIDEVLYRGLLKVFYINKYEIKNNCDSYYVLDEYSSSYWDYIFKCKIIKLECSKEDKEIEKNDCNCIKKIVRMHIDDSISGLHSDMQCIVLDKAINSFKSYWAKREKGLKASKPFYLHKNGNFVISFNSDRNIKNNKNEILLRLGTNANYEGYTKLKRGLIVKNENLLRKEEKIKKKDYFILDNEKMIHKNSKNIKNIEFLKIPLYSKIKNRVIRQIEIKKNNLNKKIDIFITFEQKIKDEKIDKIKPVSIDLGVKYLFSIYDHKNTPTLVDSGYLNYVNKKYNSILDNLKSYNKKIWNINSSPLQCKLELNRQNKINGIFRDLVSWFCNRYKDSNTLIVGYNQNWKTKVNMGKENNRRFYEIPHRRLLNMLKEKWEKIGKRYIEINESYTSKCDSLALEPVMKRKEYLGSRVRRGLFISSIGKVIHGDINGSINIMRKYYKKIKENFILENISKVNFCYKVALNRMDLGMWDE